MMMMAGFMLLGLTMAKLILARYILMVNLTGKAKSALQMVVEILLLEEETAEEMATLDSSMKSGSGTKRWMRNSLKLFQQARVHYPQKYLMRTKMDYQTGGKKNMTLTIQQPTRMEMG